MAHVEPDYSDNGSSKMCECNKSCCKSFLKSNALLLCIIAGLICGIALGIGMRFVDPPLTEREIMYFNFPGEILMRMLRMIIIPLITSSLISGLAHLDAKASGKMGGLAVLYYLSTTFIAVIIGIVLSITIKPGSRGKVIEDEVLDADAAPPEIADAFLDLIRNMLPDNIVEACFRVTKTRNINLYDEEKNVSFIDDDGEVFNTTLQNVTRWGPETYKDYGMNVLGLVVYSIAMGIIISRMGRIGEPIKHFAESLAEASMILVTIIIWYSPIGICFLVATEIIKMEDPVKELEALGLYMAAVLTGLFIHGFIVLPLLFLLFARRNPFPYIWNTAQAIATAFGTASSSATLPVTYRCLEERNGIDSRVTRFVLPVGATINMDGTALYEAVAAIFIAQLNGRTLNFVELLACSITATFASIGAASVPQAGLITMVIVLTALDLPVDDIALILSVDWLLDRFRTAINVLGDSIGAGIIYYRCKDTLGLEDDDNSLWAEDGLHEHPLHEADTKAKQHPLYPQENSNGHVKSISNGVTNPALETDIESDGYTAL